MSSLRSTLLVALAAALLGACNAAPPSSPAAEQTSVPATAAAISTESAAAPSAAYPAPTGGAANATGAYPGPDANSASSAYPGPAGAAAGTTPTEVVDTTPLVVPTPSSAGVGVVFGELFHVTTNGEPAPLIGANVYLGEILSSTEGVEGLVKLDKTSAPKAMVNGLGQFAFTDVPPGRYGLMLDLPEGAILLNNPDNGGDMIVEIVGGDVDELGDLTYDIPALK